MTTRRDVLAGAAAGAATLALTAKVAGAEQDIRGLRDFAAQRDVLYGCATAIYQLRDPAYLDVLSREAAMLVPEYEMVRSEIEPSPSQYRFDALDAMAAFAKARNLPLRGHTLVWYAANPPWLEDMVLTLRDERLMTDHIHRVMKRYRGSIQSWNVVNEAVWPKDGRADGLRDNFWVKAFGPGYVDTAYRAAREADPDATLVYNDWGFEAGGADNDRFRSATLKFLEDARARGVPIQALGIQGHLSAFGTPLDQKKLDRFVDDVIALGLTVLVTEHDVFDGNGPDDIALRDSAVADTSRRFLDVMLDRGRTRTILTWGLTDKYLRTESMRAGLFGDRPRKLPLDAELRRKPMWQAMARAFAA